MLGQSLEHDLPGLNAADWQNGFEAGLARNVILKRHFAVSKLRTG